MAAINYYILVQRADRLLVCFEAELGVLGCEIFSGALELELPLNGHFTSPTAYRGLGVQRL